MISVTEALQLISSALSPLPPIHLPLSAACGHVLATDVAARVSVPNFTQSAMDGYAFRYADFLLSPEFTVVGEVAAGDAGSITPQMHQAIRIFTGAPVPPGFDTVVMQEKTIVEGRRLTVLDSQLVQGSNVRKQGEEISRGEAALTKGTVLTPAAIGFLTAIGLTEVAVYPKPLVHIIATGKELVPPGLPLQQGQVYESNSAMLVAALQQVGMGTPSITRVPDDVNAIAAALQGALNTANIVLVTGGVSVGDYDFVIEATKVCGVQQLFHKVAQRPGKPLYAGVKVGRMVLGLPGNPASVLTCFYQYVTTAVAALTGRERLLEKQRLPLLAGIEKKIALTQFLKATYKKQGVVPLSAQESFRLRSFAVANCLIVLPEQAGDVRAGDMVDVLLLPYL